MIGYATVGSNDIEKAKRFFDVVLAPLGAKRSMAMGERMQFYSGAGGALAVCKPYDEDTASVGNGAMIALSSPSRAAVEEVHALALANGGSCEGLPGMRTDNFYGAYFRDLDGNKFCVFKMGPDAA